MSKSFEIKFKLSDLKGKELGTYNLNRAASKSISDEQLAGRNIAWFAQDVGTQG